MAHIELEHQRLGRATGEPELAPRGVVAVPLARDDDARASLGKALERHQPDAFEQLLRPPVSRGELDERTGARQRRRFLRFAPVRAGGSAGGEHNGQVAQPLPARLLQQIEAALWIRRDQSRRAPGQGRRHRLLVTRLDLEQRQRQQLAGLGQRSGGRWNALPLFDRTLEHAQPLGGVTGTFAGPVALLRQLALACGRPGLRLLDLLIARRPTLLQRLGLAQLLPRAPQ